MFEGPLEDRIAIRERIESYTDPIIQRNAEAWAENWADDAVWILNADNKGKTGLSMFAQYYERAGKQNIVELWKGAMEALQFAAFLPSIGMIRVSGDQAVARVYMAARERHRDGFPFHYLGQYDDVLVKREGNWLFARRVYRIVAWD